MFISLLIASNLYIVFFPPNNIVYTRTCVILLSAQTVHLRKTAVFSTFRVPTRPGKPGKMRVHLENLEISWDFEKFNKYHGKMT